MKKRVSVILAASLMTTALIPTQSFAVVPVPPPAVIIGGGGGSAAGAAGGVIGVAAFFVFYDLIRRTSCSGDFLGLGGPGFDTPVTIGLNVITPPNCGPIPHKRHRAVLHARG